MSNRNGGYYGGDGGEPPSWPERHPYATAAIVIGGIVLGTWAISTVARAVRGPVAGASSTQGGVGGGGAGGLLGGVAGAAGGILSGVGGLLGGVGSAVGGIFG